MVAFEIFFCVAASAQVPKSIVQEAGRLWQEGAFQKAKELYQKATELSPGYAEAWIGLGACHRKLNDFVAGRKALKKALRLDRNFSESLIQRGLLEQEAGENRRAKKFLRRIIRDDPNNAEAWLVNGICEFRQSAFPKALFSFSRAADMGTFDPMPYVYLARTYLKMNRPEEGEKAMMYAMILNHLDPEIRYWSGVTKYASGKTGEALNELEIAIGISPGEKKYRFDRAAIAMEAGIAKTSVADWDTILMLDPGNPEAMLRKAMISGEWETGNRKMAAAFCRKTLKMNQDFPIAFLLAGDIQRNAGIGNPCKTWKKALAAEGVTAIQASHRFQEECIGKK